MPFYRGSKGLAYGHKCETEGKMVQAWLRAGTTGATYQPCTLETWLRLYVCLQCSDQIREIRPGLGLITAQKGPALERQRLETEPNIPTETWQFERPCLVVC